MNYETGDMLITGAAEQLGKLGFSLVDASVTEIAFPKNGSGPNYKIEITMRAPYQITKLENPENKRSRRRTIDYEKFVELIKKD